MTRKNPPARYTLPEVPQPEDYRCYQVNVPNDPMHIAAFQGQIKALAHAYTWANDPDHTALLAAEAWKPVFDDLCLNPSPCGIVVPIVLCIGGSFADDPYGFVPGIGAPCSPDYVPETGFVSCFDGATNHHTLDVIRIFDAQTFIRTAEFHFFRTIPAPYSWSVDFFFQGNSVYHADDTVLGGGGAFFSATVDQQSDAVVISAVALDESTTEEIVLDDWQICYTGDFPLSGVGGWTLDFQFSEGQQGWAAVVAGGVTYANWTGSSWTAGCLECNGADYDQIQIRRTMTPSGTYAITLLQVTFSCEFSTKWQTTTSEVVNMPAGTNIVASWVPENPTNDSVYGSNVLRCIGTNEPGGTPTDITIHRVRLTGTGSQPS